MALAFTVARPARSFPKANMILKIDPAEPIDLPVVCGLFADCESADGAWDVGATRGYGPAEVSIVVSDGTRKRPAAAKPGAGSGVCGMIDSTVSGLTSVLGAIGTSFLVPDVGLVVA